MNTTNFANLSIEQIIDFLERESWKQLKTDKCFNLHAFETPDGFRTLGRIFLPHETLVQDKESQEYRKTIYDSLESLSIAYDVPIETMIVRIQNFNTFTDSLFLRLNPEKEINSLSLSTIQSAVDNIADFLGYAACAEEETEPRRYYPRMLHRGVTFKNQCRFGHTFQGSFGLKITCSLSSHQMPLRDPISDCEYIRKDLPIGRRVLERAIFGLVKVQEATFENSHQIIVDTYKTGMNANMCGALEDMLLQEEIPEISWNFELDQALPIMPEIRSFALYSLSVKKDSVQVISEARKKMTPEPNTMKVEVSGHVIELRAKNPKDKDETRVIKIETNDEQFSVPRKIYLELSPDDYATALKAHGTHKPVLASGILEPIGRSFRLKVDSAIKML